MIDRLPASAQSLPVAGVLGVVRSTMAARAAAVLRAPPGAGKTTLVPLALDEAPWLGPRRVVMLEPRRLAARAAAYRMASLLRERVGDTIGLRTRLETRVGSHTRVEVVTEGVLTRMLQSDPTLERYGLVIFDEFHERSLNADVGLALTLQAQRLVRPDLRILVMSATMDTASVASLLGDAPVIACEGLVHDVLTEYLAPPRQKHIEGAVASAIRQALAAHPGDVLAFLPGAAEIRRVAEALAALALPSVVDVHELHGMLTPDAQDRAIAPSPDGRRKVVLASAIAETSLTIEGVRIVVDAGLSRRPRFSPRTGMTRLETTRVSRAAADQRRGRAGRLASGVCLRLWDEHEFLVPFAPPEIVEADLVPLALDLAAVGVRDPAELSWLDAPPPAAFAQARELLGELGALDRDGRVTAHGRRMTELAMHPRLAHMVLRSHERGHGALACCVAALLGERDPLRMTAGARSTDIALRVSALRRDGSRESRAYDIDRGALHRIRQQARRWTAAIGADWDTIDDTALGPVVALAWPDRVAQRRQGSAPRYVMRGGTGAVLQESDPLQSSPFLAIAETDGRMPESRAYLVAAIDESDALDLFRDDIAEVPVVEWSDDRGIRASLERRLGAIVLGERRLDTPPAELVAEAVTGAIRRRGLAILHWTDAAVDLRQRFAFLHRLDAVWPDVSDAALERSLLSGLASELGRVRSAADLASVDVTRGMAAMLDGARRRRLDELAPTHFTAPTGSRLRIDYADPDAPVVRVRLQEMFGCATTPRLGGGRVPIIFHLLSPAQRPVQITRDLAGFWSSSYDDVRKDMRARYPRHAWPEDPLAATPTTRAKPRR